ncbi:MAG: NADH-quinone oxidoreductase subunit NuoF [Deltaproteobacteria bacterium]|nr:NADH-quinone oxidoreductase subunit NuoF [Deltaproteobacteria bacterium]
MKQVIVGMATCGLSAGAQKVYEKFDEVIRGKNLPVTLKETGCIGMCYREVLVEVRDGDGQNYLYGEVTPERVGEIVENHLLQNRPLLQWVVRGPHPTEDDSFFAKQKRIVLRNCGHIDPNSIDESIRAGGYQALRKVLLEYSPERVIEEVTRSQLRGRGGAGFPTGIKWGFARKSAGEKKYVICNADEGDPGAFMDRSVLEGDPHSVIEGMIICGYAIGAKEGYIYVRAEYPKAIQRLRQAIAQAEERGFLGENIFQTDFSFRIKIKEGAGAFVCGEETALIASIEGRRGHPRLRPPFPAVSGLWGKPTNINNVETFANIPWIILNGPEAYASLGTDDSKGTKVFALTGKVKRGGLVEVPMGITINEIIYDICGGMRDGKQFKGVQMGGPSGGCIPAEMGQTQIDYAQVTKTGAIMGSGGMVVMDESTCMVDVAKFFLNFTQNESCGKCVFCRLGTKRMLETLERITEGEGKESDLDLLSDLAQKVKETSLCGLGQTAPNPVLTTVRYFRKEYEAHIFDRKCPAHVCSLLLTYSILPESCTGCGRCAKSCPVQAIYGERKEPHFIQPDQCVKCGRCFASCSFGAISKD